VCRMRTATSVIGALVVAAVVGLAAGSVLLDHGVNRLRDPRVTCGAHVMKPGDTCTAPHDDGSPTTDGYAAVKTDQAIEGYVSTIGGAGLIVAGAGTGVFVLVGRRRRRHVR
jgi:hypothetical protein